MNFYFLTGEEGTVSEVVVKDGATSQAATETATTSSTAASTSSTAVNQGGDFMAMAANLLPILLLVLVGYFLLFRPQKKKEKEQAEMRNSLQIGDEIVTSSGIVGIVVSIKEDTLVIETGSDRSKIRIKRWAIHSNETLHDAEE